MPIAIPNRNSCRHGHIHTPLSSTPFRFWWSTHRWAVRHQIRGGFRALQNGVLRVGNSRWYLYYRLVRGRAPDSVQLTSILTRDMVSTRRLFPSGDLGWCYVHLSERYRREELLGEENAQNLQPSRTMYDLARERHATIKISIRETDGLGSERRWSQTKSYPQV